MRENVVYTSSRYDDFAFKAENRSIDEPHVEKLANSFEKYGWVGSPIEVSENRDGKLYIEEGQHRFLAAKKLNLPIKFIVVPPRNAVMQAEINDLTDKWKPIKFVEMYANNGVQSYKRLLNLVAEFPQYKWQEILIATSKNGGYQLKGIKEGRLQLSGDDFLKTRNVLNDFDVIYKAAKEIGYDGKPYISAYLLLLKNDAIEKERMAEKIEKYGRGIFEKVTTVDRAVDYIERVYNFNSKKDIVYLVDQYKKYKRGK